MKIPRLLLDYVKTYPCIPADKCNDIINSLQNDWQLHFTPWKRTNIILTMIFISTQTTKLDEYNLEQVFNALKKYVKADIVPPRFRLGWIYRCSF